MSRITDLVPVDLLEILQEAYQNYLQTSAAIYELDGSYAASLITSKYCNCLTDACEAKAGQGKGICHDDCWQISKKSIDLKKPFGEECSGGLFIYSVPIMFEETPVGAANAAVSNPPKDIKTIKEIAEKYGTSVKEVQSAIDEYEDRPEYVRESAKRQIEITARTIGSLYKVFYELRKKEKNLTGEIAGRKRLEDELKTLNESLERRVAERTEELQGSKTRLQNIIDNSSAAIYVKDTDYRLVLVNRYVEDVLHLSKDELIGKTDYDILPKELADATRANDRIVFETGAPLEIEERIQIDNEARIYIAHKFPLLDSEGAPYAVCGISTDITERKRAEDELKVRAQQGVAISEVGLHSLKDTDLPALMGKAVTLVAKTLSVEYCKVLELLPDDKALLLRAGVGWKEGYVGHATVGTGKDSQAGYTLLSDKPVIVEDLRAETRFSGPQLLIDHGVVSGMSTIIQGKERPFGILGAHTTVRRTFTKDDINFLQAISNILAETIERKQAEEQLKESLKEKEILLQEIHHRVNNNLQVISSLLDMSRMRTGNEEAIDLLKDAGSRIRTMALIHSQLYRSDKFDRIDMEKHLREVTNSLLQLYGQKKNITIDIKASEVYMPVSQAIPCALVLNELISNAFKHAYREGQKGTIRISMQRLTGDTVRMYVKDDGIGIPEEVDPFKMDSLGLKLVRNLVEKQLKGKLQFKRNKGTEFTVEFKDTGEDEENG